jgi:S1-C subfamily serine protease
MMAVRVQVLLCAALIFLSSGWPLHATLPPEEIYANVAPSVLTLEVKNFAGERFVGSAFLAIEPGVAVTAWHLVRDAEKVEAWSPDHKRVKVFGLVARDEQRDLALLKVETNSPPVIPLATSKPRVGSRAYVIGAPRGLDFSIADGMISQLRHVDGVGQYQLSCPVSPGNSGGPVLNDEGQVIGVVSWRKADAQNLSFAVPVFDLQFLDASHPVTPWPMAGFVSSPSTKDKPSVQRVKTEQEGLDEFRRALAQSAGKRVTVTLSDGDDVNDFTFVAPQTPSR